MLTGKDVFRVTQEFVLMSTIISAKAVRWEQAGGIKKFVPELSSATNQLSYNHQDTPSITNP